MNYSVDELFSFTKYGDGYAVDCFNTYPDVTEVEIPAEYNGKPVRVIRDHSFYGSNFLKRVVIPPSVQNINSGAFLGCRPLESAEFSEGLDFIAMEAFAETGLKSVRLPKSLTMLGEAAFRDCPELERVEFNSEPDIGFDNFSGCPKLPPETVVMGLLGSTDITCPVSVWDVGLLLLSRETFHPDVFELLAKNDCFRECGSQHMLEGMINNNKPELFPLAEQYEMLESAGLVDELLDYSIEKQTTEITAYLLELKKRKFGFEGSDDLEL